MILSLHVQIYLAPPIGICSEGDLAFDPSVQVFCRMEAETLGVLVLAGFQVRRFCDSLSSPLFV